MLSNFPFPIPCTDRKLCGIHLSLEIFRQKYSAHDTSSTHVGGLLPHPLSDVVVAPAN
jgi:hypothetical protein